ncbi:ATP-binding protein [Flavonifractor sp. An9]|uniref:ATP-binding protein n=1 Tax=Flavonifractor sp. An9 TaxID=1965664 RepID=UPI000B39A411|nr:ATP-binding protein [Flavonifractor sp. An9]OUN08479.1 hypothetical protein B5G40_14545 [Flavonifractor sp. An9]
MNHKLVIGKYTLESLTNGMYASPLDLYREYIQNAADSIDTAIAEKLERPECFEIAIHLDHEKNMLSIFDNGHGLSKKEAISTLIDIGNSNKHRTQNRGFRGIGRLAGLGYCDELIFITSFSGESTKTLVHYNAKLLRELLLTSSEDSISVNDVMNQIVFVEEFDEKPNRHYFEVKMLGVMRNNGLMDEDLVRNYLIQHSPLPFRKGFKWRSTIEEKLRLSGYTIPTYCICLNGEELYKPYTDSFISDRVKKISDSIQDIHVKKFYRGNVLSAVLWYAHTAFYGTINDNSIKGIRVRQGNILIGDKSTCNSYFKEERFNGWIMGELYVIDPDLIANSRRDDFEKNEAFYELIKMFKEWAVSVSKDIRRISYERSLSREKKAILEAQSFEDINDLYSEDYSYAEDTTESDFLDSGESEAVAEMDYWDKLSSLIDQKKTQTRYRALNINFKLTAEQRKVLERVFDLIQQKYESKDAEKFINMIASNF